MEILSVTNESLGTFFHTVGQNDSWIALTPIQLSSSQLQTSYVVGSLSIVIVCILWYTESRPPLVNPKRLFELSNNRVKREFIQKAPELIEKGFILSGNKPFRMMADIGEVLILPPELANEIRNDERLTFARYMYRNFHAHLPGFEAFIEGGRDTRLVKIVSQKQLTTTLNKITVPLSEECALSLRKIFTEQLSWHDIPLKQEVIRIVARLSSKVLLGDELCHNERWLKLTTEYTTSVFEAAVYLRIFPYYIRFLIHWFVPSCRVARKQVREARELIESVLRKRAEKNAAIQSQGEEPIEYNNSLDWFEQAAKGSYYDPAISQLMMSVSAIHTSADLITQTIYDLAEHPEVIEPLRREIITVLSEHGWRKTSLYKLKLMDSVIKETQRLKPVLSANMRRVATDDITLSDGTRIRKGSMVAVSAHAQRDPERYPNPDKWDGYRFYNMRQKPGFEYTAHLVSTSPEHLGFGHGLHACPGRFFAANEIKIFLCHLLLKYDFKLTEGSKPQPRQSGFHLNSDPAIEVSLRRRSGVDISVLET